MELVWAIVGLGALGGVANSAITGEFVMPVYKNGVWRPGWIGNVIVGSIAALVIGGMYGPLAQYSADKLTDVPELIGAVVIGLGGGNILTQLAQRNADKIARGDFAKTILTNMGNGEQPLPDNPA